MVVNQSMLRSFYQHRSSLLSMRTMTVTTSIHNTETCEGGGSGPFASRAKGRRWHRRLTTHSVTPPDESRSMAVRAPHVQALIRQRTESVSIWECTAAGLRMANEAG
ncbi:hypothetical protein MPTK1_5g01900 [Marchantia polymorpha subsp. ruderalis]|uniref:Uncharacterized protein n=2 Tax=Marchantia polymorpha TaxID=3197 RepID=A0AAF6BDY1_MARPO|nr:hypothetical protein MARPO_0161s0014 [Marchantia polymorpha]BBN10215.1 hypothetical protein Mp_5g01900 [Marchantia polymorpha subsp. ruderalis]|eukprot:PTQ28513.1 hypothetical protein MARPO_0161s0014 [Marchantia polymorpha]